MAQVEASRVDQDLLVYPIVFSYRQYLELSLKSLRSSGFELFGWSVPTGLNHRLSKVWDDCYKVIQKAFPNESSVAAQAVHDIIDEFDALDPNSMAFRYATSKNGGPSLPAHLLRINLRHLRDTMAKVALFLDSAAEGVAHMLHARPTP